jgi:hypothetical protein
MAPGGKARRGEFAFRKGCCVLSTDRPWVCGPNAILKGLEATHSTEPPCPTHTGGPIRLGPALASIETCEGNFDAQFLGGGLTVRACLVQEGTRLTVQHFGSILGT